MKQTNPGHIQSTGTWFHVKISIVDIQHIERCLYIETSACGSKTRKTSNIPT